VAMSLHWCSADSAQPRNLLTDIEASRETANAHLGVRVGVWTTRLSGVPESTSRSSSISLIEASGIMPV
jgi:hypothetical protein